MLLELYIKEVCYLCWSADISYRVSSVLFYVWTRNSFYRKDGRSLFLGLISVSDRHAYLLLVCHWTNIVSLYEDWIMLCFINILVYFFVKAEHQEIIIYHLSLRPLMSHDFTARGTKTPFQNYGWEWGKLGNFPFSPPASHYVIIDFFSIPSFQISLHSPHLGLAGLLFFDHCRQIVCISIHYYLLMNCRCCETCSAM